LGENGIHANKLILSSDTIKYSTKSKKKIKHKLPQPPTRAQALKDFANNDCMFMKRYSVVERLKHYPFSKAAKIMIVSYPFWYPEEQIHNDNDTTNKIDTITRKEINKSGKFIDSIFPAGLHVRKGILNYSSLKETIYLNQHQINSLTNIIYNTAYKKKNMIYDPGASCFNPRNALVFLDKNGKIFDYLEVCFECQRYSSLSGKISIGTYCNQKYDLLKQSLIGMGIKYGTIETRDYLFTK